ncbi:carotenoid biosynthesis protein [Ardenticatena maritima]|uniref:carotenoid biosynthesis protein n=3 Tax=Ardenticatena maritima TaxID=872965 RepID=UPI0007617338|nr:carotenoid biosynthesis protein [Ardenticatena maritima]
MNRLRMWAIHSALWLYIGTLVYTALRAPLHLPLLVFIFPLSALSFVAFSALHAWETEGGARALAFIGTTIGIGFAAEWVGVKTGWPFGAYTYSNRMGGHIFGVSPFVPPAWFMMGYVAWRLGEWLAAERHRAWQILLAAWCMTAWDLLIDPIMVYQNHWTWLEPGAYFGIPAQNYAGWFFTAALMYTLYWRLARPAIPHPAAVRLPLLAYTATWLFDTLIAWQVGLHGAAVAGFWGMGGLALAAWARPIPSNPEARH